MNQNLNSKVPLYLKEISTREIHFALSDIMPDIIKGNESIFKLKKTPLYMYFNPNDLNLIKHETPLDVLCPYGRFPFVYKVDYKLPQGEQYIKLD